jgi:hypothetical protein
MKKLKYKIWWRLTLFRDRGDWWMPGFLIDAIDHIRYEWLYPEPEEDELTLY